MPSVLRRGGCQRGGGGAATENVHAVHPLSETPDLLRELTGAGIFAQRGWQVSTAVKGARVQSAYPTGEKRECAHLGVVGLPTETKSKDTCGLERHSLALCKRIQLGGLLVKLGTNVAHCPVVSNQPYRAGARPGVPVAPGLSVHCIRSPLPP